jgi:uncharacterized protein with NRDE domain
MRMCFLAMFHRVAEDAPVVVGANREEFYRRGGEPPRVLGGPPRALAGLDPSAGGTWLGVNQYGLLVAVTNRRKSGPPDRPRSRGLLVRDLLRYPGAGVAAEEAARALGRGDYDGCNLLCADARGAVLVQAGDWLRVRPLPPGLHVLTNGEVNDARDRRIAHALERLGRRPRATAADCLRALGVLCAQAEPADDPICQHGADRGTVSSTLVALRAPLARSTYVHAQGPPDRTTYADCGHLLRELAAPEAEAPSS